MEAHMEKRLYGLFEKREGKWIRLFPELAYPKSTAVRLFQNHLLAHFLHGTPERSLRVVPKAQ
jgi:hypothetical protein